MPKLNPSQKANCILTQNVGDPISTLEVWLMRKKNQKPTDRKSATFANIMAKNVKFKISHIPHEEGFFGSGMVASCKEAEGWYVRPPKHFDPTRFTELLFVGSHFTDSNGKTIKKVHLLYLARDKKIWAQILPKK